jgi:hypothetical protein
VAVGDSAAGTVRTRDVGRHAAGGHQRGDGVVDVLVGGELTHPPVDGGEVNQNCGRPSMCSGTHW